MYAFAFTNDNGRSVRCTMQTKARFKPIYSLHVLEKPVEKIKNLWRL